MSKEPSAVQTLHLGMEGRLLIPKELRRRLGLEPGGAVAAWVEGDRLILQARATVEEELWRLFRDVRGSMASELVAERRREAESERATYETTRGSGSRGVAEHHAEDSDDRGR